MRGTVLLLLVLGARIASGCTSAPRPPPCPLHAREPKLASKAECLLSPWFGEDTPSYPRWSFEQKEKRIGVWTRSGATALDNVALAALRERLRKELLLRDVWYSSGEVPTMTYCATSRCLDLGLGACQVKSRELMELVERELSRLGVEDAALEVVLHVTGELGPRCAADDPKCGPLRGPGDPLGVAPTRVCSNSRTRLSASLPAASSERCSYDGECTLMCESCVHWTAIKGSYGCLDHDFRAEDEGSGSDGQPFCGCVAGGCAWFRP